jgi:hypothetical protein
MGKLSDQAMENLMRLSASITSDLEVSKFMESSSTKSNITLRVRYRGQRRVRNFMLHENIPKAFASSSDNITVSVSGATYEVVEKDPEYVFLYGEVSPNQELTITYSVDQKVDTSVLDQTETVVYGEGYEAEACTAGEKRCLGNDLQECREDGTGWVTTQTCDYGCENNQCKLAPPSEIDWSFLLMGGLAAVVIVIIVVLIIFGFRKRKKPKLLPKPLPDMRMRPNLP